MTTKERKFKMSVTLSRSSIDFVGNLEAREPFSTNLEKVVQTFRHTVGDYKRADNIAMLRAAAQVLKRECACPPSAIVSWAREASREVK